MKVEILNFSGIYLLENFYKNSEYDLIDCSHIDGTNCYCDDEAVEKIEKLLSDIPLNAIHFIDSGNYHYVSKLWSDKIEQPFNLLVFDHHNDMQEPMFGDILSCGGWIKKVLDANQYLNKIIIIGVRDDLAEQIPMDYCDKVICYNKSRLDASLPLITDQLNQLSPIPFYISIDKDAFSTEFTETNWDQGSLSVPLFTNILNQVTSKFNILGIDVCGEPENENVSSSAIAINNKFNKMIIDYFNSVLT